MDSDDNVKKITRFLENGGTMLANHCEQCGAPLFRFKGEIICPLCSNVDAENKQKAQGKAVEETRAAQQKTQSSAQKENKQRKTVAGTSIENMTDLTARSTSCSGAEEELRELILLKLTAVAEEMQDETDSRRVFESLEIIEKGLDLIERLY
jgi:Uncharacterized Zn-finger containing protein